MMLGCSAHGLEQTTGQAAKRRQQHRPCVLPRRQITSSRSQRVLQPAPRRTFITAAHSASRRRVVQVAAVQSGVIASEPYVEFMGVIGGMQTVRGSLDLDADARLVYDLLTDYPSCSRVFRNVAASSVQYSEGRKQVLQACKWQFLTFSGTFNVLLDVTEEEDSGLLVFRMDSSTFLEDFEGRWQVTHLAPGRCTVDHVLAVKPSIPVPASIAQLTSKIFEQQVKILLKDLSKEVGRQVMLQGSD